MAARHDDQGVAIRRRGRDRLRSNHKAGARAGSTRRRTGLLFGDHFAEHARQDIDAASGGLGHQNTHGFGRKRHARRPDRPRYAWPLRRQSSGTTCPCIPSRYLFACYLTSSHAAAAPRDAGHGYDQDMLTIPPRTSSFAAPKVSANETIVAEGRTRMAVAEEKTSPEASGEELARDGAANAQAQRHPPGPLRARPRPDDADPEFARRSVFHHLPHRARGGSGRHRLRRLDGRHAGRGADADVRVSRRWPTSWRRWRSPTRSR